MKFQVSVVMPVYNAARFVSKAVESVLAQPETAEVVLVDDGSKDDSLLVCQRLAEADTRVKIYQHPDYGNHGAGASRNLGILRSTYPYIAFLDADDYFLPGRFATARQLFEQNPAIEGVYEAIIAEFEDETAEQRWYDSGRTSPLTTLTQPIAPQELFDVLVYGKKGYFSGDGLVVKRSVFDKTGLFGEHRHEDTAMWIKMAAVARLVPGRLDDPVAVRLVHSDNRVVDRMTIARRRGLQYFMWQTLWVWSQEHLDTPHQKAIFNAWVKEINRHYPELPSLLCPWRVLLRVLRLSCVHTSLLNKSYFWRTCAVLGLRGLKLRKG